MKTNKIMLLCCLLTLSGMLISGCKKKSEPASSSSDTQTTQEQLKATMAEKTEEIKEVVNTLKADMNTSISEIKAEVEKLNVDQLRAAALEYQQLIEEKTKEIGTLTAKLKELDVTQMLGDETQAIKADIDELNKSIAALKERFQIYYNKLKEKGGNLTGLMK